MSIPTRHARPTSVSPDRTFFVTTSCWGQRNLLQSDRAATLLVEILQHYRRAGKFNLHEFVVMPNHLHALITVDSSTTIERAVQLFKGGYSYRAARELHIGGDVWQRGFSEVRIVSSHQYLQIHAYILANPVKAGLVRAEADFRWSSSTVSLDGPPQRLKPSSGLNCRHD